MIVLLVSSSSEFRLESLELSKGQILIFEKHGEPYDSTALLLVGSAMMTGLALSRQSLRAAVIPLWVIVIPLWVRVILYEHFLDDFW